MLIEGFRMKICRQALVELVELIERLEIFFLKILLLFLPFPALFIRAWDIIFVEDVVLRI